MTTQVLTDMASKATATKRVTQSPSAQKVNKFMGGALSQGQHIEHVEEARFLVR
jgi:hypothetical protein